MNKGTILKTILVKEIMRFSRIWLQTIFPPIITTVLYLLIFGELIGERIGLMAGVAYIDFIVPGIILMTVITNSYANTVASFYLAKYSHSIEEILVSPASNWIILLGFVLGGVTRGVAVGLAVSFVVSFFVDLTIYHWFVLALVMLLTATLFSLAGFINAVFATSFDDISIIPTFVLMPLTYLGGMFYSIDVLPEFWQALSHFNPIFYMVDSFRFGFLGVSVVSVTHSILVVVLIIAILLSIAMYLLNKGVRIKA